MTNKFTPIKNHIVFQFVDEIDSKGTFIDALSDTIILTAGSAETSAASPRWGKVVMAGPEASSDVSTPGTLILIENLKWTIGFKVEGVGETYWRTDDKCVIGVAEL